LCRCGALLGKFLSVREPNIRYLGLETMARLANRPGMHAVIQTHQVRAPQAFLSHAYHRVGPR
jgi:AP-2 complex subunit alpha